MDRIAYVNSNGDLFTVDPDGDGLSQLTGGFQVGTGTGGGGQAQPLRLNEYYAWPTWSADGTKLAASRVVVGDDRAEISVQVLDARSGRSETVYENEQAGLIADGAPHYLYWAPAGDALSFLASTPGGLSLFVWDGTIGIPARLVEQGAPLYYHLSKNGAIALHVGPEITFAESLVDSAPRQRVQSSGGFRVPAISPDGESLAYVADADGGMGLYIAPVSDLGQARKIIDVGAVSAFLWSPDASQLVVGDQSNPRIPFFDRLMLAQVADGTVTNLSTEGALAFYWAPTGDKLAWVEVNPAEQEMEWVVGPADGSDARRLFSFRPSAEVFIMLSFFDQYAYSHSPWSPDGKSLVVAGSKGEQARRSNGRTPTGDRVYVLDAEGGAEPRDLGAGVLAFWSWN
ncbi:MAG: hypothetical protein BZY87_03440 [SAR202 cluster bacterium Io17-Chloro-G6]|nr:MAG: hypothetical protein BZY87_03440 [SAR202 cluster bacterium Io17-Chloro-G6]